MNSHLNSEYRRDKISQPFETLFSDIVDTKDICKADFMVRLEVCIAMAAYSKARIDRTVSNVCSEMFPEINWTELHSQRAFRFAKECRIGLKILSDNEPIMIIQKIKSLASIAVLVDLARNNPPYVADEINRRVFGAASDVINNMRVYSMRVYEVIDEIFGENTEQLVINSKTKEILRANLKMLEDLFDNIHSSEHKNSPSRYSEPVTRDEYSRTGMEKVNTVVETAEAAEASQRDSYRTALRDKAIRYANAACLLETSILNRGPLKKTLEKSLIDNWKTVFSAPLTNIDDVHQLMSVIQNDQYLQILEKLLCYTVSELYSDVWLRKIVVARCVHRALSVVPRDTNSETVFDEALSLYSGINVISIGREEDDIKNYLKNFILPDGSLDGRAIEIFREHKKEISNSLDATRQGIAESKTRNRYVDNVVDEKDRQIAGLQEQLDNSQFSSLYKLTAALTNKDYGYLLSRIYRIANGYDIPEESKTIGLCMDLLQILRAFGITPTHENSVGETVLIDSDSKVTYDSMTGYDTQGIVFPGWRVKDDVVALPVSTKEAPTD